MNTPHKGAAAEAPLSAEPVLGGTPWGSPAAAVPNESAELRLLNDVGQYLQNYAKERPEVAALWCFGIGFVLGWRLKPW